jgi:hypothetical protein
MLSGELSFSIERLLGRFGRKPPKVCAKALTVFCVRCGVTVGPDIGAEIDEVSFENFTGDTADEYTSLVILSTSR